MRYLFYVRPGFAAGWLPSIPRATSPFQFPPIVTIMIRADLNMEGVHDDDDETRSSNGFSVDDLLALVQMLDKQEREDYYDGKAKNASKAKALKRDLNDLQMSDRQAKTYGNRLKTVFKAVRKTTCMLHRASFCYLLLIIARPIWFQDK